MVVHGLLIGVVLPRVGEVFSRPLAVEAMAWAIRDDSVWPEVVPIPEEAPPVAEEEAPAAEERVEERRSVQEEAVVAERPPELDDGEALRQSLPEPRRRGRLRAPERVVVEAGGGDGAAADPLLAEGGGAGAGHDETGLASAAVVRPWGQIALGAGVAGMRRGHGSGGGETGDGAGASLGEVVDGEAWSHYQREVSALFERVKYYPRGAQRAGQQGTVVVEVIIDAEGTIVSVEVVRSSGFAALDRAAVQAAESIGKLPPPPLDEGQGRKALRVPYAYRIS